MTSRTIRQACLAFLDAHRGEWCGPGRIEDAVLGRAHEKGDYAADGPRTRIDAELMALRDDGLIHYRAHLGYALRAENWVEVERKRWAVGEPA